MNIVINSDVLSGAKKLIAKIKEFNPKIAVFNGKGIYEVFSGQKEFIFGKQPEKIKDTETVRIFTYITTYKGILDTNQQDFR